MIMTRRSIAAAGALAVVGAMVAMTSVGAGDAAAAPDAAAQPQTIPAVQEYTPGETTWQPTVGMRVLVPSADADALADDAQTLADELVAEVGLSSVEVVVGDGSPEAGDVVLAIGAVADTDSDEAYRLEADETVRITGPSDTGVFWGTRTLLQSVRLDGGMGGTVVDEPGYEWRGLQVDVGRKYFTPDWLEERIREVSWLKMNVLHLHLSENLGFRVELESHPEIVDQPALTKEDVARLVEVAEQYHVTLVPEVDSPGHLDAVLDSHPELQLVRADGSVYGGHLDYSKPEARQFMAEVIGEVADMFPGPYFHLGGDEYYGAPWQAPDTLVTAETAPQLMEYAIEATGDENASFLDGFDAYMNGLVDLVGEKGKRAIMWNDEIRPGDGVIDVDKSVLIEDWIRWRDYLPSAVDFIEAGYDVFNANGDYLYYILTENGRNETGKKSPSGLYEDWTARTFMGLAGGTDLILDEDLPMKGAQMSIWADQPDNQTQEEVAEEAGLWFRSFAQNTWDSPKTAPTWAEFVPMIDALGMPPVPKAAPVNTDVWTDMSPAVRYAEPADGQSVAITDTTRIIIDSAELADSADLLASELARAAGLSELPAVVEDDEPEPGDVVLAVGEPDLGGADIPAKGAAEAYRIDIDGTVRIEAASADGIARAVTSLAKAARVSPELASVVVIDAPAYAERSVMMDVGRKYYSPEWMKALIREMAWNQLNTLHLHLNDNEGFRVSIPSYPGTASPDAWSDAELADILDTAKRYHVDVIPEIDSPGHMDWILRDLPEYQLELSDGTKVTKALDYSNAEAAAFLRTVISETMAKFPDSTRFHIGGDEYFLNPITAYNTPQLLAYAREKSGSQDATVEDGATYFLNELGDFVAEQGKIPRVWNDGVDLPDAIVPLDKDIEVEVWSVWGHNWNQMNAQDFVDQGYTVVNAHGDYYFIIRPEWDNINHERHSPRGIFENWAPNGFMNDAGGSVTTIPADSPYQRGAGMQVWADDPGFWTPTEVWSQLQPWLLPLGQRTWDSPRVSATYDIFLAQVPDSIEQPNSVPMAPANLALEVTADRASATWEPPLADGGPAVSGYVLQWTVDDEEQSAIEFGADVLAAEIEVPEGAEVSVSVLAVNALGESVQPALFQSGDDDTVIVSVAGVDDIEVPFSTTRDNAVSALAPSTTITDDTGTDHEVNLTWDIADYDGTKAGDYAAVGSFELPEGVAQPDPPLPLTVRATITVLPQVTPTTTVTATTTATATTSATATVTATATTTATATVTATATTTATATATTTETATSTATATKTVTATTTEPTKPTVKPTALVDGITVYTTPGYHKLNGRSWYTSCEPYSQTIRCTTDIWSTQVQFKGGKFLKETGWHFNNLTYLPEMTRAQWSSNPLANIGAFTSAGRQWRTECDTAVTGRGACRSYIWSKQVAATQLTNGTWSYAMVEGWVFNNIVRFRT